MEADLYEALKEVMQTCVDEARYEDMTVAACSARVSAKRKARRAMSRFILVRNQETMPQFGSFA